jgi:DNA-binding transcriptional ArsR family regulator
VRVTGAASCPRHPPSRADGPGGPHRPGGRSGSSNRQIAEALGLSPRTVGYHLYKIFPKLDVTSRAQLAAALGQAGLGRHP